MKHIELENKLRTKIRKQRIIEAVLSIVFLVLAIVFTVLYLKSKVVEEIGWGAIKYQSISYNNVFLWGILIGFVGYIMSFVFLISDFLFSKLVTLEVDGDYITFYRGMIYNNLYINGDYKDGLSFFGYYLEASLSDGTKVNVALGKWSAHLTFSNGHPPIDV